MKKKNSFLFVAMLFAALSLGFSACENPDDNEELLERIEQLENQLKDQQSGKDDDKTDSADKDGDKDTSSDNEQNGDGTPDPDEGEGGSSDSPVSNFTPAAFSVSADKQVYFSPGNLQYIQSSDTWQFASFQWDYIGTNNVTGGEETFDERFGYEKEGTALADKVDLFGWSTSATNFGVSTSEDYKNDYLGTFVDWGVNQIGADAPNTWRTLTKDEWNYLLNTRTNASSLKGVAQVNGVNGLILLPDSWTCPDGITFKSGFYYDDDTFYDNNNGVEYYAAYQTFTADQWQQMEAAGAVFLPAAGHRGGSGVYDVQYSDGCWSATEYNSNSAGYFNFYSGGVYVHDGCYNRIGGLSVRLVKDL